MNTRLRYKISNTVLMLGIFIFIILTTVDLQAQCQSYIQDVILQQVEQLSVGSIDFERFEGNSLLFTIKILNGPDTTRLHITADIFLTNGTNYQNAIDFTSKAFYVQSPEMIITNLDIGRLVQKDNLTVNQDAKKIVQDIALTTGKFPAGNYIFHFSLICNNIETPKKEGVLVLQNPTRVELRSPQDGEVTSEFPLFEFFSDFDKVELTITEKSPNQSRDEAISHEPVMNRVELTNQNTFLYSGGRPLEAGKTYVWKVVGKIVGPGNVDDDISSPINLFTVSKSEHGGPGNAILKMLEEMFGNRYPSIFTQIREGQFNLSGIYSLNREVISQGELLRLLNELRQFDDNVELSLE